MDVFISTISDTDVKTSLFEFLESVRCTLVNGYARESNDGYLSIDRKYEKWTNKKEEKGKVIDDEDDSLDLDSSDEENDIEKSVDEPKENKDEEEEEEEEAEEEEKKEADVASGIDEDEDDSLDLDSSDEENDIESVCNNDAVRL